MKNYINFFDDQNEVNLTSKTLGNKGYHLFNMKKLRLPVPEFFVISSDICKYYHDNNDLPPDFQKQLRKAVSKLQNISSQILGDINNPLTVSIRSGASISMPGMMDTILNVGLTENIINKNKGRQQYNFLLKNYYRLVHSYAKIVAGIEVKMLELDDADIIQNEIEDTKFKIFKATGSHFPEDPIVQITNSVVSVIKSWMSPRAVLYRQINDISDNSGTSITIQKMVFGNLDGATGVIFTRNPSTGKKELYGEYLLSAQGEDIVAGIKTPKPVSKETLGKEFKVAYEDLVNTCEILEKHYKDVQDIEFTIENGKLYLLQTRSAKRTTAAAIKIAADLLKEKIITEKDAIAKIEDNSVGQLLHPCIDYSNNPQVLGEGLPASPGGAIGRLALSTASAKTLSSAHKVVLCREQTSPEDIEGINIAEGIFTAFGGMTSHAAVITRSMGKPCVCGVKGLLIDQQNLLIRINGKIIHEGEEISIDGNTGKILDSHAILKPSALPEDLWEILNITNKLKNIKVRANADTIEDMKKAFEYQAEGIGLCRTEHMMLEPIKLKLFRQYILSDSKSQKIEILDNLERAYAKDFYNIFSITKENSIAIRLLDPPLHEFLPHSDLEIQTISESLDINAYDIKLKLQNIKEYNPMLGHRGCRLGITNPQLYSLQVKAMFEAAISFKEDTGILPKLEITVPFISTQEEMITFHKMIKKIAASFEDKIPLNYKIGAMIELPRSCLIAGEIAKYCDYFSFGTNDLTQTTYGISRDDLSSFLPLYLEKKIFNSDPFVSIDTIGVGELMKTAIELGKKSNPQLSVGVCGEHGGDPKSIKFFSEIGIDYISCSPYRILDARIAAAKYNKP